MLRNPSLVHLGVQFPENVYEIKNRMIYPINGTVNVEVCLSSYTNETQEYKISEFGFLLKNLPNDPSQLGPILYQTALLNQHGNEVVDGTLLSEFGIL